MSRKESKFISELKKSALYKYKDLRIDRTPVQSATAERRRENLKLLFNHTTIIPFKWKSKLTCFYCSEIHTEYAKFRKHTISHGPCSTKILERLKTHREIKIDVSEIVCELCQTEFKSLTVIVDHLINSHSTEYDTSVNIRFQEYRMCDLRCVLCDKQFKKFKILVDHMRSHSDRYECNDCGGIFTNTSDIAKHIRTHHVTTAYVCKSCGKKCVSESLFKRHDCREYTHQCTQCDAQFKYPSGLKKHVSKDHDDVTVKKRYRSNSLCHQIRRNILCVLNMSTAIPFKFKGNFCCFYCSNLFTDFDELTLHTRAEHPICDLKSKVMKTCKGEKTCVKLDINGLTCKVCHQTMSDLNCFVDHAIAEHKADYDKSVPLKVCFEAFRLTQGRIPCPQCQVPFAYFATLLKHLGAEHNHHKAVCAYCGRGFRTTNSLTIHITNSHTGMCECNVCNVKCKNSAVLARHMARYHDAKDFKCPQCPEQFETMYKKQNHLIKAHNVGHKCAYCGKMFTRNSFMRNHVRRTHLKERTVPCSVCHVKFFDIYHMKLHMVKHEGMRKFRCEVCGKSFLRVRNLKSHMDTHKKGYLPGVF